jgi:O-antigen/teichoic acid export membrane protein
VKRHSASVLGYGLSIAISAVVTLMTIPILIERVGADAWAGLAVGQAVGTGGAILIGFGWGTTGPVAVAKADDEGRKRIYVDSLRARVLLAVPVTAGAMAVTLFVMRAVQAESAVNAASYSLTGLLAGWYFSGAARPYSFLALDTAPRVVGAAAGVGAVFAGAPLMAFPVLQLVGVAGGILLSTNRILGWSGSVLSGFSLRRAIRVLRGQSHGMVLAIASAGYSALPVPIVALAAPASLPAYVLIDKLLRFATTAYAPLIQFLQGWVPGRSSRSIRWRIRMAFFLGLFVALTGGAGFAALALSFSRILSHGQVSPARGLVLGFAVTLACMVMSAVTGLVCLLSIGKSRQLAYLSAVGVAVGLPAIVGGALTFGAVGAAWMLALGESVMLAPQLLLLWSSARHDDPIARV